MTTRKKGKSSSLRRANLAIENTLKTPRILEVVSDYGYSLEHMQSGLALYEAGVAAVNARTAAAGAQTGAKKHMETTERAAFGAYQKLSEIAKAVFRDNRPKLVTLGLHKAMPRSTELFLTEAFKLFSNAPSKAELAQFGYTSERYESERAKILAYQQAANEHRNAMGAAQLATQHQEASIDALNRWTDQYLRIARAVLKHEGQLLEKIGIKVRTRKTAAQRQAPKKAAATRAAKKAAQEPEPELV